MEHWYIWQPKVTNALKTINDQLYHKLAADFSLIMGAEVSVSILKHEDSWKICYQAPHSESDLFTFIFSLYDPAKKEYLYSGFEIEEPTIDIHKLLVLPQGQGLATQIMYKFFGENDRNAIVLENCSSSGEQGRGKILAAFRVSIQSKNKSLFACDEFRSKTGYRQIQKLACKYPV